MQALTLSHDLIGEIYEASSRPAHWQRVLSTVAQNIGADSATLLYRNFENPESNVSHVHTNQSAEECAQMVMEYENYYHRLDPMWQLTAEVGEIGVGIADSLLGLSREEYEAQCPKEYLEDYMQKYDRWYVGGSYIFQDADKVLVVAVQRGVKSTPWTAEEMAYLTSLTPHFQRAFRIHREFSELRSSSAQLTACINRLLMGVIIIKPNGKIGFMSELAERTIATNPLLSNSDGLLKASPSHNDNQLQEAINHIRHCDLDEESDTTQIVAAIALRIDSSAAPLPVLVAPIIQNAGAAQITHSDNADNPLLNHVAIFFADPECAQQHSRDMISEFYGLTRAEAGVAIAISNGHTVAEYAQKNNVAESTVRTQIKQIFQKLNVSRQAEIVKVLLQTPSITSPMPQKASPRDT